LTLCRTRSLLHTHPYKQFIRHYPVILAIVLPVALALQVCRMKCFMHFWYLT
jgi:hypothetical protein